MTEFSRRGFLQLSGAAAAPSTQPNILFIMADQLRYDCLGSSGNRLIRTPNLDRLAAQSANFSNAFVQAPVCVPSRISFFTGRYPHSHRNRVNYTPCDPRETLLEHRSMWVQESPTYGGELNRLTEAERAVYQDLRGVRLEQERIRFHWVEKALRSVV